MIFSNYGWHPRHRSCGRHCRGNGRTTEREKNDTAVAEALPSVWYLFSRQVLIVEKKNKGTVCQMLGTFSQMHYCKCAEPSRVYLCNKRVTSDDASMMTLYLMQGTVCQMLGTFSQTHYCECAEPSRVYLCNKRDLTRLFAASEV